MGQPTSVSVTDDQDRILLILPCFNEEKSIGSVLAEVYAEDDRFNTIVIDDGSSDKTHATARMLSPCVRLIHNLGIGGAVQTGIKYAVAHDYDCCIQVDGDGQHPPDQVKLLVKAWKETGADIIIGSRYLGTKSFQSTWARRLGSSTISLVIRQLFGGKVVTDCTSGLRLMNRRTAQFFSEHYPIDYPEPISIGWALRAGFKIHEVPVVMRAREHGKSSIGGLKSLSYMVRVVLYLALTRIQPIA